MGLEQGPGEVSRMTGPSEHLISPRLLFFAVSLAALLALSLSPLTRKWMGIFDGGHWFLDSYAVLASSDADRVGIDPDAPNPYDVLERSHKYSDWWFGLGRLGLTRDDNFLLGGSWVVAFLVVVFLTLRPSSHAEALWLALLLASPSVLLGINRANNDLVVFTLLGLALVALRDDSNLRAALAIALVALATGLKFYPVVAVGGFVLVRSSSRILRVTLSGALAIGAVLASVASQISRGSFPIGPKPHRMGGKMVFLDLGLNESAATGATLLVFAIGVFLAVKFRWAGEPGTGRDLGDKRRMMTMGSVVLVACFLLGINVAYRWIFALWAAPWLWENRGRSVAARCGVWLLPFALWHDGLLCLAINRWVRNRPTEFYERMEVGWRVFTEPFVWALMILLGAWLVNTWWAAVREVRDRS